MIVTVYFLKNQFELSDTLLEAGYKFINIIWRPNVDIFLQLC